MPPHAESAHRPIETGDPERKERSRRPLVFAALAALLLISAAAWFLFVREADPVDDVAVAGETTIAGTPDPTTVTSVPAGGAVDSTVAPTVASTIVDEGLLNAFSAEVRRACAVINDDPGLATEAVMQWNDAWSPIGKTEIALRDEINNCALPARDRALAALGANENAALENRLAQCKEPDVAALRASIDSVRGQCFTVVIRVEARAPGACQADIVWDASAKGAGAAFDGGPALLRAGNGRDCPQLGSLAPGSIATAWVTWKGATLSADGADIPLMAVEQIR